MIQAIKHSKIFLDFENTNFENIKKIFLDKNMNNDFFQACTILKEKLNSLKYDIEFCNIELMQYSYLDLLCYMSMYMMKYTKENLDTHIFQNNGDILTLILQERLRDKDRKKRPIDEKYILEKLTKKFLNFESYENSNFEEIVEKYKKLYLFKENVLSTFCFDDNFTHQVHDNTLEINVIDLELHKQWYQNGQKLSKLFRYYTEEAFIGSEELLKNNIFGLIENDNMNQFVYITTLETYLLTQEQYGLSDEIQIDENSTIPLFESIHSINNLKGLYQKYFLQNYLVYLDKSLNWSQAWQKLLTESRITNKNRFPLIHAKVGTFSKNMTVEENKQIDKIEKFWTMDLKEINNKKIAKITNLYEKPFMKIDDYVFVMPYLLGYQNSSAPFINSLLRVSSTRKDRINEVKTSEDYLAKQFTKTGFNAKSSYHLPLSNDYHIGDVDVICEKDGYLFLLELKSTYVRSNFESTWKYKTDKLRKAANQLRKREFLVNKLIKDENSDFTNKFGNPKKIFYWIVDTSFEFDHEYFSEYLKISLFEVLNALIIEEKNFSPNEFNVENFVETIEKGTIWNHLKLENIEKENINYRII